MTVFVRVSMLEVRETEQRRRSGSLNVQRQRSSGRYTSAKFLIVHRKGQDWAVKRMD